EAGFGFALAFDKPSGFIGRDAVLARKAAGPLPRRLLLLRCLAPDPLMFHAEVVRRDGVPVGYVRAASYGHTLGGAVGLAMLSSDEPITQSWLDSGEWTVEVGASHYPARASLRPLYDPNNERIRA